MSQVFAIYISQTPDIYIYDMMGKHFYLFVLALSFLLASCSSDDKLGYKPFSLDSNYEVMLGDTLDISIVNGSGDLDIYSSDDGNIEVAYKKEGANDNYGRISVVGRELGTSAIIVTDKETNEKCTVSVKVVSPYILMYFEDYPEEWAHLGMGNLQFKLDANESKSCYALRRFIDGAYQFETKVAMTGSYNIAEKGTILSLNLKGDNIEFVHTFMIKKGDISLLQKIPDIEKESPCFEGVEMSDSDTGQSVMAVITYKKTAMPSHSVTE